MKPKRKPPTAEEKIACLLIENRALRGDPIADWETLRQMTAHSVCSLFQWQHTTYHDWCRDNHPTRLTPLYILNHREQTAKVDLPTLAKSRRIRKKETAHKEAMQKTGATDDGVLIDGQARMAAVILGAAEYAANSKPKRKLQSRGFQGWRKFDGTVRWKDQRPSKKGK